VVAGFPKMVTGSNASMTGSDKTETIHSLLYSSKRSESGLETVALGILDAGKKVRRSNTQAPFW